MVFDSSVTPQITKLSVPTSSGSTSYGTGADGQVLKTNGTTVYWGSDDKNIVPTKVSAFENDAKYISELPLMSHQVTDFWNLNGKASGSQSVANASFFCFRIRPLDKTKPFTFKFRGFANMPRWTVAKLNE